MDSKKLLKAISTIGAVAVAVTTIAYNIDIIMSNHKSDKSGPSRIEETTPEVSEEENYVDQSSSQNQKESDAKVAAESEVAASSDAAEPKDSNNDTENNKLESEELAVEETVSALLDETKSDYEYVLSIFPESFTSALFDKRSFKYAGRKATVYHFSEDEQKDSYEFNYYILERKDPFDFDTKDLYMAVNSDVGVIGVNAKDPFYDNDDTYISELYVRDSPYYKYYSCDAGCYGVSVGRF